MSNASTEEDKAALPASEKWALRLSFLGFMCVAFSTYFGARHGKPWVGAVVMPLVHLFYLCFLRTGWPRRLLLSLSAGLLGFALDSALGAAGIYSVAPEARWFIPAPLCPLWLLILWVNFGFYLYAYVMAMRGKLRYTMILGAVFALFIYPNAGRMEVLLLRSPALLSVLIIAACWVFAVPALYRIGQFITEYPRQKSAA
jgi:hypothetical protein